MGRRFARRRRRCARRARVAVAVMVAWLSTVSAAAPLASPVLAQAPCTGASASCTARATVDFKRRMQEISGFGVAAAGGAAELVALEPPGARSRLLSLFFSTTSGAGFSIVRTEVGSGSASGAATIEPKPGVFDWVPVTLSRDHGQLLVLRGAQMMGVKQVLASVWSPPAWMKSNRSVDDGGHVLPSDYAKYARYLAEYVNGYPAHYGISITAISPASDPNVDTSTPSSDWSAAELDRFIGAYLGPYLRAHHVGTKVVIPEQRTWNDDLASATLADGEAADSVDVIAGHGYASTPSPLSDAIDADKPVWQTQVSNDTHVNDDSIFDGLQWARNIDGYLSTGASAWFWWEMANTENPDTDGQALVHLAAPLKSGRYTVAKRLWTIGNFSRFVRPGWYMVQATHTPTPEVDLTAFTDPRSARFAVVAINLGPSSQRLQVALTSKHATSVVPYVTSSTLSLREGAPIRVSRGAFTTTLPAMSVTTFTDAPAASPPAPAAHVNPLWFGGFGLLVLLNLGFWITRRWRLGIF